MAFDDKDLRRRMSGAVNSLKDGAFEFNALSLISSQVFAVL